jgi:hypothetical protein
VAASGGHPSLANSASTRSHNGIGLFYPPATGHAPPTPPVVRAEAARIPWVPPLASELERLLMADAIGPANISHNLASE